MQTTAVASIPDAVTDVASTVALGEKLTHAVFSNPYLNWVDELLEDTFAKKLLRFLTVVFQESGSKSFDDLNYKSMFIQIAIGKIKLDLDDLLSKGQPRTPEEIIAFLWVAAYCVKKQQFPEAMKYLSEVGKSPIRPMEKFMYEALLSQVRDDKGTQLRFLQENSKTHAEASYMLSKRLFELHRVVGSLQALQSAVQQKYEPAIEMQEAIVKRLRELGPLPPPKRRREENAQTP